MGKYTTKYFGEITIDESSDFEFIETSYRNQAIHISLSDCSLYGPELKTCLGILDRYAEIDVMARKAILENFPGDETVAYYFECHFDSLEEEFLMKIFGVQRFDEFDIARTTAGLGYPDLLFGIEDGKINFSVDYMVSKDYSDEILCVKMDRDLNVTGFSHES
ncbi:DUF2004 domain-containing protein [Breznakiella homolactica]|nr:DUF2004 domain-containing protein [Breznakiella homolactica]QQO08689.2 DUF2004 domain-containing protein [Breznakiella homolactica]